MKKDDKESLKKEINKVVELSKNLPEPTTEEQQKALDNIMDEINDLNNYLNKIIKNNKKDE